MNTHTITEQVQLTTFSCGKCGATYAINEVFRAKCQQDGSGWHCPYCRVSWGYFNDNENAQLKRDLAAAQRALSATKCDMISERLAKERAEAETKRVEREAKRIRKRAHAGVCICCNRTFQNLAKHMQAKHPDGVVLDVLPPTRVLRLK